MANYSGLSNLLHGVISLPDATSYDKKYSHLNVSHQIKLYNIYLHFNSFTIFKAIL